MTGFLLWCILRWFGLEWWSLQENWIRGNEGCYGIFDSFVQNMMYTSFIYFLFLRLLTFMELLLLLLMNRNTFFYFIL